jgi:hypothetical protein
MAAPARHGGHCGTVQCATGQPRGTCAPQQRDKGRGGVGIVALCFNTAMTGVKMGVRGSVLVKAPSYKPESRGFETR